MLLVCRDLVLGQSVDENFSCPIEISVSEKKKQLWDFVFSFSWVVLAPPVWRGIITHVSSNVTSTDLYGPDLENQLILYRLL